MKTIKTLLIILIISLGYTTNIKAETWYINGGGWTASWTKKSGELPPGPANFACAYLSPFSGTADVVVTMSTLNDVSAVVTNPSYDPHQTCMFVGKKDGASVKGTYICNTTPGIFGWSASISPDFKS